MHVAGGREITNRADCEIIHQNTKVSTSFSCAFVYLYGISSFTCIVPHLVYFVFIVLYGALFTVQHCTAVLFPFIVLSFTV